MTALTNFPPADADPLRERLAEDYAGLVERTADLVAAAGRVPTKLDDETLALAIDFLALQLKPHRKVVNQQREHEKAPFLSGCRIVDAFFGSMLEQLTETIKSLEGTLDANKPAGASIRGGHGGLAFDRSGVGYEITERQSAAAALWPYFDDEAFAKAARARIKAGGDALKAQVAKGDVHEGGVRFFNDRRVLTR